MCSEYSVGKLWVNCAYLETKQLEKVEKRVEGYERIE